MEKRVLDILRASSDSIQHRPRVLIGCSGSVATIKVPEMCRELQEKGATVIVIPTKPAVHFLLNSDVQKHQNVDNICAVESIDSKDIDAIDYVKKREKNVCCNKNVDCDSHVESSRCSHNTISSQSQPQRCSSCPSSSRVFQKCIWCAIEKKHPHLTIANDDLEWNMWEGRGDPVLHIELRRWADLLLIAPLSANSMAKLAGGLCDNLLTCVVRAWDTSKPLLFCPAMNTLMYEHPLTAKHIAQLKDFGYTEVPSISKRLICGDGGMGAMAEVSTIVREVWKALQSSREHLHVEPMY